MAEEQIMHESDEAAVYETRTVTGWWDKGGRYHGEDESTARYCGSTHSLCKCGEVIPKGRYCDKCFKQGQREKYARMEEVKWDQKTPLHWHGTDVYFFSPDDLADHCEDKDVDPNDLELVLAEPVSLSTLNEEYWCDDLAEDGELPDSVLVAIDAVNKAVQKAGPQCWRPGNKRVRI